MLASSPANTRTEVTITLIVMCTMCPTVFIIINIVYCIYNSLQFLLRPAACFGNFWYGSTTSTGLCPLNCLRTLSFAKR